MTSHEGEPVRAQAPRVIHTAQALVDEVVVVDALPVRGGNAVAQTYARYAGGAVNILVAAARSGAQAVLAGAVGTGANGDLVRSALAAEGVAVSSPPVADLDTGICFVMVEPSAERTFVTTQGAERRISVESLQTSAPVAGDLVCLSGFSLVGLTRDPLLEWLDGLADGVVVVLDPGAAFADLTDDLRERVLARTSVWTSNAEEAEQLTGHADPAASVEAVAGRLPRGRGRHRPRRAQGVPPARGWPHGIPAGLSAGGGRHQRRGGHPHRSARRVPCGRRGLGDGGQARERGRGDQGDPAWSGDRAHSSGDRQLPR